MDNKKGNSVEVKKVVDSNTNIEIKEKKFVNFNVYRSSVFEAKGYIVVSINDNETVSFGDSFVYKLEKGNGISVGINKEFDYKLYHRDTKDIKQIKGTELIEMFKENGFKLSPERKFKSRYFSNK